MIHILSPAKNLNEQPKKVSQHSDILFAAEASEIMQALKKMKPAAIAKLMEISPKLTELNHNRFQNWQENHTESNSYAAVLTFNGDAYLGMQANDFSEKDLLFAQNHLRILSGLYGLLRPLDLIQPYRLEMGRKLKVSKKKDLYAVWGNKIAEQLNNDIAASGSEYLINIASQEYFQAVDKKALKFPIITCEFKEGKNGSYKPVMVFAKKARGMMSRFIIENKINNPTDLCAFDMEGYMFNNNLSTEQNFVFNRN